MDQEKLTAFMDMRETQTMNKLNEKSSGLVLCGIIIGIILAHSNLLGYSAGLLSGILISNKYESFKNFACKKCLNVFNHILKLKQDLQKSEL